MTDALSLAAGATNLAATGVYTYVGYRLFRRPVSAASRLASAQFTVWWYGLAASTAFTGAEAILAALGALTFPLALTFTILMLSAVAAFLWGLVGYLLYIYTGKYQLVPLSVFYAVFYAVTLYSVLSEGPYGVVVRSGIPTLQYTTTADPALLTFVVVGLLFPELGGAILYLSLLRQTSDRTQRYRILLVGLSILMWFAIALAVPSTTTLWELLKGLLESVAALLSLVAFLPPSWIQSRLHVATLSGPEGGAEGGHARS